MVTVIIIIIIIMIIMGDLYRLSPSPPYNHHHDHHQVLSGVGCDPDNDNNVNTEDNHSVLEQVVDCDIGDLVTFKH